MNRAGSLLMLLLGTTMATGAHGAATVGALRCEYRVDPQGIGIAQPRLSWILESASRDVGQTAYQILVADSEDALTKGSGNRWDSGKVSSDQSHLVAYAGPPLKSRDRCYWKVRVWDAADMPSAWSAPAQWSMGLLDSADWQGSWIGLDLQEISEEGTSPLAGAKWIWLPGGEAASSAPVATQYFRREVTLPAGKRMEKAQAFFTADNSFKLHINGKQAGAGSDFHSAPPVDVMEFLHEGKNMLAVSAENSGDADNPAGLLGVLQISFEDGDTLRVATDGAWRVTDTPKAGWRREQHDDASWEQAQVLGDFGMAPWGTIAIDDSRVLPAHLLRREFQAKKAIRCATASLCGLGLFELEINGEKVSQDVLVPALTEYDKRAFYLTYDVTDHLVQGGNAIGVHLGNGRYFAPRLRVPTLTRTFGYPKLIFNLLIEYQDGSTQQIVSDTTWKVTDKGPIRTNCEYDGETYDATMEMPGWSKPGFDDAGWRSASKVPAPEGKLAAQMIPPIRVMETLKPIAVTQPKPGIYIFDMGQNMVGWCKMTVSGPKGTEVKLRHAEVLADDGTLYLANIRGAKVTDTYVLKGKGVETYEPRFTYHGFRFVEVTGYPGTPTRDTLQGCVVHDDLDTAGHFACSNPLLNRIYRNVVWGVRGNYRSFPTDCPQRDERQAWLGDRSEECRGESYLFNIAPLYSKWLTDIEDSQKESGSVSDVSPAYWPLYNDNVTWPSSFIIIPGMIYDQYGDRRPIEMHYRGMKRWIEHMCGYLKDGLMPRDSYGDWCVPPESPELIHSKDPLRKTRAEIMGTTYFYHDLKLMGRYAAMLGKDADAADFLRKAEAMREAFNKAFFNAETELYDNGSQTSCVLPLAFGMVPQENRQGLFENLVEKILVDTKGHIGTGLVGGQWLTRVLSDNGRPDVVYTFATQTDYPSWGYMIENDATTIWELWNGNTADPAMNSHNHVMLVGDLILWFYEYLAGIKPASEEGGFQRISIRPYIVDGLTNVEASVKTTYGTVASQWERGEKELKLEVTIPANCQAHLCVPTLGWQDATITESGTPVWKAGRYQAGVAGVSAAEADKQGVQFDVGSGAYRFVCVP